MDTKKSEKCTFPVLKKVSYEYLTQNNIHYQSGTGMIYDPFIIATKKHLDNMRIHPGSYFKMCENLIFASKDFEQGGEFYNNGEGWQPIGIVREVPNLEAGKKPVYHTYSFFGKLDGNGHYVKNLYMYLHATKNSNVGLFFGVSGIISEFGMIDCDINVCFDFYSDSYSVGSIAGILTGKISKCYVNGANINSSVAEVGGIVGVNYGLIEDCFVLLEHESELIGKVAGGIAGYSYTGSFRNSYSAIITHKKIDNFGAICGDAHEPLNIDNCYFLNDYVSNWKGSGDATNSIIGLSNSELKSSFNFQGFDFENIWTMQGDIKYPYPELKNLEFNLDLAIHDGAVLYEWIIDKDATCEENGSKHKECSECHEILETEEIPATGHDLIHHDKADPTCTTSGHEAYDTCSKCDYSTYKEIPALGHDYETKVVEPTCTKDGYKEEVCTRCGDTRNRTTLPATGHTYGDWIIDKEVTCTKSGSKHKTCGTCGDVITETIAPHGHDLIHHDKVNPTCTTSGHEAYDTCSKCDYSTYKEIPALGHDYVAKVVEPTCTKDGYKEEVCTRCGETRKRTILPATGHTYGDWIVDKDATCIESGSKHKTCGTCGDIVTETIAPRGHDLIHHDKVDPTCTTSGHEAYDTCSKCDYSTYKEIPAKGHNYGEWKVEVEPTTDSEGFKTRTCSICGEKETEVIPKLEKEINLNPIIIGGTCALGGLIIIILIIVVLKNRNI